MSNENKQVMALADETLERFGGETLVPKSKIVDVFLDMRLAASGDRVVVAVIDAELSGLNAPNLLRWDETRESLARVYEVAANPSVPAMV